MRAHDWTTFHDAVCAGTPDRPHDRVQMAFSHEAKGLEDGAYFLCTACNQYKFVRRTPFLDILACKESVTPGLGLGSKDAGCILVVVLLLLVGWLLVQIADHEPRNRAEEVTPQQRVETAWPVQLKASRSFSEATRLAETLRAEGIEAVVHEGTGVYKYKVRVLTYTSEAAYRLKSELLPRFPGCWVVRPKD